MRIGQSDRTKPQKYSLNCAVYQHHRIKFASTVGHRLSEALPSSKLVDPSVQMLALRFLCEGFWSESGRSEGSTW